MCAAPSVLAEPLFWGARKSLACMNCPEKKPQSRNSGTVQRGGGLELDSREAAGSPRQSIGVVEDIRSITSIQGSTKT